MRHMRYTVFMALICFVGFTTAVANVQASSKVDDVFMDEGDGDFDMFPVAPIAPSTPPVQVKAPEEKLEPSEEISLEPSPHAKPAASAAPAPETTKRAKQVKQEKKKRPVAVKPKATKSRQPASADPGVYLRTRDACPMRREPASESAEMLMVKAARKLWVQEVDGSWVRAFNKAGEPGYIHRDCFE